VRHKGGLELRDLLGQFKLPCVWAAFFGRGACGPMAVDKVGLFINKLGAPVPGVGVDKMPV
jgi:hypothetical protein